MSKPPDPRAVRSLASLPLGGRGRISELRLEVAGRRAPGSPLRRGAEVQVLEANPEWLHVRIESREYPVPRDVAERVLVTPEAGERAAEAPPPSAPATAFPDRRAARTAHAAGPRATSAARGRGH